LHLICHEGKKLLFFLLKVKMVYWEVRSRKENVKKFKAMFKIRIDLSY